MNSPILLQLVHIDLSFQNIDEDKIYRCLASNTKWIEEIYVIDIPQRLYKRQRMPIIRIDLYRFSKRLQNKLFVISFKTVRKNIYSILGNPKNHPNRNPNFDQGSQILNEPANELFVMLLQQMKKPQPKIPSTQLSIQNLTIDSINYYFLARVIDKSSYLYCQNERWEGQYFYVQVEDTEYSQIRILFYENHCQNYQNKIQIGEVYEFHNFQIRNSTYNSRKCQHQFFLVCDSDSLIKKSKVTIEQVYTTIDQAYKKQIGDLINIIAFIQVETENFPYNIKRQLERRELALNDLTGTIQMNIWDPQQCMVPTFGNRLIAMKNVRVGIFLQKIQLNSTIATQFITSPQQIQKENSDLFAQLQNIDQLKLKNNKNTIQCLERALGKSTNQIVPSNYVNLESDDDSSEGFVESMKAETWDRKSGKSIPHKIFSADLQYLVQNSQISLSTQISQLSLNQESTSRKPNRNHSHQKHE